MTNYPHKAGEDTPKADTSGNTCHAGASWQTGTTLDPRARRQPGALGKGMAKTPEISCSCTSEPGNALSIDRAPTAPWRKHQLLGERTRQVRRTRGTLWQALGNARPALAQMKAASGVLRRPDCPMFSDRTTAIKALISWPVNRDAIATAATKICTRSDPNTTPHQDDRWPNDTAQRSLQAAPTPAQMHGQRKPSKATMRIGAMAVERQSTACHCEYPIAELTVRCPKLAPGRHLTCD